MMGVILAAILSSSMCSIDSQMLATSSALTEDIYRALFRKQASQQELIWVGRITVFLSAGAALYIARVPAQGMMGLVSFAWAGLGSTFAAAIVLSLYWKRTTQRGVVIGMLVGCLTALCWRWIGLSAVIYEILPGTVLSALGVVIGSLCDKKPSQAVLDEYKEYQRLLAVS
jgi:sodium/proline symporter